MTNEERGAFIEDIILNDFGVSPQRLDWFDIDFIESQKLVEIKWMIALHNDRYSDKIVMTYDKFAKFYYELYGA